MANRSKKLINRDHAYAEYIINTSKTALHPVGRIKLLNGFSKATGYNVKNRVYDKRFDVITDHILHSNNSVEVKARAFFFASIPVTNPNLMEEILKVAKIKLDTEARITDYQSKIDPRNNFCGKHRKIITRGKGNDESHMEEGRGAEGDEEEDDEVVMEDVYPDQDDSLHAHQGFHQQQHLQFQLPPPHNNHFGKHDDEQPEQKPFNFGFPIVYPNQPGPSGPYYPQMSPVKPLVMAPQPETPSGRISTAPSISSIHNFHQMENQYANFLKGVHFFLQDYARNPLDLKKMAREAKENHHGMSITPRTLISYLEVCLGDVICLGLVPNDAGEVVNLKEFLEELKKCAEDFGDVLQSKIVRTVDGLHFNGKDDDKVSLASVMDSFGQMVRKLKARAEKLGQRA